MTNIATFLSQLFLLFCLALSPYLSQAQEVDTAIANNGKININTASAELLADTLKGVGLKKAQAIIRYREAYGAFHNVGELESVSGIGEKLLSANAERLTVE